MIFDHLSYTQIVNSMWLAFSELPVLFGAYLTVRALQWLFGDVLTLFGGR